MNQTAYLSSTYEDLREYRDAVYKVLAKMRYTVRAMEDYVARDDRMVDQVLRDVAECDLYLGIFAWRYGYIPPDQNPEKLSITEIEYREALKAGKPRLVFLIDENAPWPRNFMDSITGEAGQGSAVKRLRRELSQRMHSLFSDPNDLAVNAAAAVHLTAVDARAQSFSGDLSSASCLTLATSTKPEIMDSVERAVTEEGKTQVIKINLGIGESWWSTRLHLLAALCGDYTEVRQIVFEAEGNRFLGMCTPAVARRVLASQFPDVESAYRNSLPSPRELSYIPVNDVRFIVERFSSQMDQLGGEQQVKQWVKPHVIENWPGVSKDAVQLQGGALSPATLELIVAQERPFVVVVRDGKVQRIVDRVALATRMATAVL